MPVAIGAATTTAVALMLVMVVAVAIHEMLVVALPAAGPIPAARVGATWPVAPAGRPLRVVVRTATTA